MRRSFCYGLILLIFASTALWEFNTGRTLFGPEGRLGIWAGDIWSAQCSQYLLDPYSITHICHGFVFYGFLWLLSRRIEVSWRYIAALSMEAGWEILENSSIVIDRYRHATIAVGYSGDSILNSISDMLMMSLGFYLAWKLNPKVIVTLFLTMEILCGILLRDNLSLNVIMLLKPLPAIKTWQESGQRHRTETTNVPHGTKASVPSNSGR